jgi:hypothetical protein
VYESRPCNVIITLGRQLYMIPEVAPPTAISTQSNNNIKQKVVATSVASTQNLSLQQKQVDEIMEEYKDIFSSPIGVPMHCKIKHPIDLTPGAPLPNGPVYHLSLMENEEIKRQI